MPLLGPEIDSEHEAGRVVSTLDDAFCTFKPRPDQPQKGDEQAGYFNSKHRGVSFMLGGNGAGTTTLGLAKAMKFVLHEQPPPRENTPFWVIAESYEQVMEACWAEKLYGRSICPHGEIEFDRIAWMSSKDNWPKRVPLKPWEGRPGKNWVLEFKSYRQGRSQMQARAIGGFLFVEQFPWGILEEVLRGSREYEFPGSKLAEFTPVDPALSIELQDMIDEDDLPPGWAVYWSNTECAVDAGQVSQQWFDEFFGMLPDEVKPVRCRGQFGQFEGQIYQTWNSQVHAPGDDVIDFPENVEYRRAIDWGAGPENAFCCLWAYKTEAGQWFVFDEYYSTDQTMTTADHLEEVSRISDDWDWNDNEPWFGTTYADPSNPDGIRLATKLTQYKPDCRPLNMTAANNSVYEGIEHVRYMLKPDKTLGGQCRLYIHRERCPNLVRQMRTYRWERGSVTGANPRDAKPKPLKKDDHAVDALRYLVYTEAARRGETITRTSHDHSASSVRIRRRHESMQLDRGEGRR